MNVKASVSFCGAISMRMNEERKVSESDTLTDLLRSGYVTEVLSENVPKKTKL